MPEDPTPMVIVVGTSHSIQLGKNGASGEADEQFTAFLESICHRYRVRVVAEEMNTEALAENKRSTSIPQRLATSLKLEHRFCDPNRSERIALGILQENDIRARAFGSGSSEAEIVACVAESHQKRERYWLDQLRALDRWPVLFVCGADHVGSLATLLEREGIAKLIAAQDWAPNQAVQRTSESSA